MEPSSAIQTKFICVAVPSNNHTFADVQQLISTNTDASPEPLFHRLLWLLSNLSRAEVLATIGKKAVAVPNTDPQLRFWLSGKPQLTRKRQSRVWVSARYWSSELKKHINGRVYYEA